MGGSGVRARAVGRGRGSEATMMAAVAMGPARLPALCKRRLADFLQRVDDIDLLWLREIREEATRMFGRYRPAPPPPPAAGR